MTLSPAMIARVADRRATDWCHATPIDGLNDEQVADLILREDAQVAALKAQDLAAEDARLAALGLTRGQIVRATGSGSHYDSHCSEVIPLDGTEWSVAGVNASGRVVLIPSQPGGHYALVRREQVAA